MPKLPSQVRAVILDEHALIRQKLAVLETLLTAEENEENESKIREHLKSFNDFFMHHLALEEEILRPLLLTTDAWGEVRVHRMDREHFEQRKLAALYNRSFSDWTKKARAKALKNFIELLRKDMIEEERELLSANLLRDDVVTICTQDLD